MMFPAMEAARLARLNEMPTMSLASKAMRELVGDPQFWRGLVLMMETESA